jgi:hypothetical protein
MLTAASDAGFFFSAWWFFVCTHRFQWFLPDAVAHHATLCQLSGQLCPHASRIATVRRLFICNSFLTTFPVNASDLIWAEFIFKPP